MKNIEINKVRPEYNIIDVRDFYEYESGHIYNAVNIPMEKLLISPSKYLKKGETYYIYCNLGNKSRRTCELLEILGYDVINMYGGYKEYIK